MNDRPLKKMRVALATLGLLATSLTGCASEAADAVPAGSGRSANVVDITVEGHGLDGPESIPSGWTTMRFHNRSGATHFVLVQDLPDGKTVDDSRAEIYPVFQDAMDLINAGDPDAGFAEFARLPEWASDVVYTGGPGFAGPGEVVETTLYLEPGVYMLECYVKTGGVFHDMSTGLVVTDETTKAPEPDADVEITVSSENGFEIVGEPRPGRLTFAVHFEDQTTHGNVLGHDVHLARVGPDTDLDELATWMNWIVGLETPAPAQFLGGTHDMPAGSTAYFTVQLTPGEYVLIAEVDDPAGKGMLETFTVPR